MKFSGNITPGKIFAVLVLGVGAWLAAHLDDANIVMAAIGTAGGFYAYKKHEDRKRNEKHN